MVFYPIVIGDVSAFKHKFDFSVPNERLFFFKSEQEFFLLKISRILNTKSFSIYISVQQDPKTEKYHVNSFLFLFQPVENKFLFKRLRRILKFGDIVLDPVDKTYVMFRIIGIDNIEYFLSLIKNNFIPSFKFYDEFIRIFKFKKKKNIGTRKNFAALVFKIGLFNLIFKDVCIKRPKDLTPEYVKSRLRAVSL